MKSLLLSVAAASVFVLGAGVAHAQMMAPPSFTMPLPPPPGAAFGPGIPGPQRDVFALIGPPPGPPPFMAFDVNNDGTVTRDEFTRAQHEEFDRLDRNHNGSIDGDELGPPPR